MKKVWLPIWIGILALTIIVFCLILPPTTTDTKLAAGLACMAITLIYMLFLILKSNSQAESDEFPMLSMIFSVIHYLMQASCIYLFGILALSDYPAVGIHLILLILFFLVIHMVAGKIDETNKLNKQVENSFVSQMGLLLKQIVPVDDSIEIQEVRDTLDRVLHSSPHDSSSAAVKVEAEVAECLSQAINATDASNQKLLLQKAASLLKQRNAAL